MTGIFRMTEECHLGFLLLLIGCFKKNKDCPGNLVFMFLMISSVMEGKECVGHLAFLFLLNSYRSYRHCVKIKLKSIYVQRYTVPK